MGIKFEFASSTQIIFENGSFKKVPGLINNLGNKVFIVSGRNKKLAIELSGWLTELNLEFEHFSVSFEPTTENIELGAELARTTSCNVVAGVGGGSVIDSAKAIAALACNTGQLSDYLEVIGRGKILANAPLPCIAIPTTAGTGAEVTKNSVIKSVEHNVKVSLRSNLMFPAFAVIDPELTLTMTPEITASTGVDALTHLLESFVSRYSNPFIDIICLEGISRIAKSLERAYLNGNDLEARENMAFASMLGGLALANVKLGAVHGIAGPMGGMFQISHGAVCASLLQAVLEVNISALKEKNQVLLLSKFDKVAQVLTGNNRAGADDAIIWVGELVKKLKIPTLKNFQVTAGIFPELIEKAQNSSSMKGNPIDLDSDQLNEILTQSL